VSVVDNWKVVQHIVVPRPYQREVISLAHDTLMAGHLGVNKTYNRTLNHFYWPKLKQDVSQYCR